VESGKRNRATTQYFAILFLVVTTFSVPLRATPTTYLINFTATSGVAPTSGSFIYDPSTGFSNFTVVWEGVSIDLTFSAGNPFVASTGCTNEAATPAYGFIIISKSATGCASPTYFWSASSGGSSIFFFQLHAVSNDLIEAAGAASPSAPASSGTWSITAQSSTPAAPAPSSLILTLIGLASGAVLYAARPSSARSS
jgi:hypothetical protein